jgi:hypothetical protein
MLNYILLGIACFGILLDFIAICIIQSEATGAPFNPVGLAWFLLVLSLFWAATMAFLEFKQRVKSYRIAMCSLTVLLLANVFGEIQQSLLLNTSAGRGASSIKTASALRAAGLIIFTIPSILILILLGSEEDSEVHQLAGSLFNREKPLPTPQG